MSGIEGLFVKSEEAHYQAIDKFYSPDNIAHKSELSDDEILAISIIEHMDEHMINKWKVITNLSKLTDRIKQHKVSKGRGGRMEFVEMVRGKEEEKGKTTKTIKELLGI